MDQYGGHMYAAGLTLDISKVKEFKKRFGFSTKRPFAQIQIYINQKSINTLYRMDGRPKNILNMELYRNYLDWILKKYNFETFKVYYFSSIEIMADYLDEKARLEMDKEFGTLEELKEQEELKLKDELEYFRKLGMDI